MRIGEWRPRTVIGRMGAEAQKAATTVKGTINQTRQEVSRLIDGSSEIQLAPANINRIPNSFYATSAQRYGSEDRRNRLASPGSTEPPLVDPEDVKSFIRDLASLRPVEDAPEINRRFINQAAGIAFTADPIVVRTLVDQEAAREKEIVIQEESLARRDKRTILSFEDFKDKAHTFSAAVANFAKDYPDRSKRQAIRDYSHTLDQFTHQFAETYYGKSWSDLAVTQPKESHAVRNALIGLPLALGVGGGVATGVDVALVDAGVIPAPNWIQKLQNPSGITIIDRNGNPTAIVETSPTPVKTVEGETDRTLLLNNVNEFLSNPQQFINNVDQTLDYTHDPTTYKTTDQAGSEPYSVTDYFFKLNYGAAPSAINPNSLDLNEPLYEQGVDGFDIKGLLLGTALNKSTNHLMMYMGVMIGNKPAVLALDLGDYNSPATLVQRPLQRGQDFVDCGLNSTDAGLSQPGLKNLSLTETINGQKYFPGTKELGKLLQQYIDGKKARPIVWQAILNPNFFGTQQTPELQQSIKDHQDLNSNLAILLLKALKGDLPNSIPPYFLTDMAKIQDYLNQKFNPENGFPKAIELQMKDYSLDQQ